MIAKLKMKLFMISKKKKSMLLDYMMSFIKKVNNMKTLNCGNYLDNEIKMQIKLLFEPRICNAMIFMTLVVEYL